MQDTLGAAKLAEIEAIFAAQSLKRSLGDRIVEAGPGRVVLAAPIGPAAFRQHGCADAGVSFAPGDSAAGYAALSLLPEAAEVLTVEMKLNLIAPAAGDNLIATGEVVKAGRRLTVVRAEVRALAGGTEQLVALLQGTMIAA